MSLESKLTKILIPVVAAASIALPYQIKKSADYRDISNVVSVSQAHAGDPRADKFADEGLKAQFKKDYTMALELYKQSVAIEPDDDIYTGIGNCLNELGKPQEAINYLNMVLRHNPEHSAAYTEMAVSYELMKNYNMAKVLMQHSLEIKNRKNIPLQPEFKRTYNRIMAY